MSKTVYYKHKKDADGTDYMYFYILGANTVRQCPWNMEKNERLKGKKCLGVRELSKVLMDPGWSRYSQAADGTNGPPEHNLPAPEFLFAKKHCPIMANFTVKHCITTRRNFHCFLQYTFGYQELLFFKFVLTQTPGKTLFDEKVACAGVEDCMADVERQMRTSFLVIGRPELLDELYEMSDRLLDLFLEIVRLSDDSVSIFDGSYEMDDLMAMNASDASERIRDGIREFIKQKDEEYGVRRQCDLDVEDYVAAGGKYKEDTAESQCDGYFSSSKSDWHSPELRKKRDRTCLKEQSKSPSLLNIGYKDLCPPLHERRESIRRIWGVQNGCCIYKPSKKFKRQVDALFGTKRLAAGGWDLEAAKKHLQGIAEKTLDAIESLDERIETLKAELPAAIGRVRIQRQIELDDLSARRDLLVRLNSHGMTESGQAEQLEEWQKAEQAYTLYKANMAAKQQTDSSDFVDDFRQTLLFRTEIYVKKWMCASNDTKKARKKQAFFSFNTVLSQFGRAKDLLLDLFFWVLRHPILLMWVGEALVMLKQEVCSRMRVAAGNYAISHQSATMEQGSELIHLLTNTMLTYLSNSDNSAKLAAFCMKGFQLVAATTMSLTLSPIAGPAFLSMTEAGMEVVGESLKKSLHKTIHVTVQAWVDRKGLGAILDLFNGDSCIAGVAFLKNKGIALAGEDKACKYARIVRLMGEAMGRYSELFPRMFKGTLDVNLKVRGGYVDAALGYLVCSRWNKDHKANTIDVYGIMDKESQTPVNQMACRDLAELFQNTAGFFEAMKDALFQLKRQLKIETFSAKATIESEVVGLAAFRWPEASPLAAQKTLEDFLEIWPASADEDQWEALPPEDVFVIPAQLVEKQNCYLMEKEQQEKKMKDVAEAHRILGRINKLTFQSRQIDDNKEILAAVSRLEGEGITLDKIEQLVGDMPDQEQDRDYVGPILRKKALQMRKEFETEIEYWKRCNSSDGEGYFSYKSLGQDINAYITECFNKVRATHPEAMFRDKDLEGYLVVPPSIELGKWRTSTPATIKTDCSHQGSWPRSKPSMLSERTPMQKSIEEFIKSKEESEPIIVEADAL